MSLLAWIIESAVVASLATSLSASDQNANEQVRIAQVRRTDTHGKRPIIVCATTPQLSRRRIRFSKRGDTLDAAIRVVKGPEDDRMTIGWTRGLPTKKELLNSMRAACTTNATRRFCRGVRTLRMFPRSRSCVRETGHVMLVGEVRNALPFPCFPRENCLRTLAEVWLLWKENHSTEDWWDQVWPIQTGSRLRVLLTRTSIAAR